MDFGYMLAGFGSAVLFGLIAAPILIALRLIHSSVE